jgi:hypothetical protein
MILKTTNFVDHHAQNVANYARQDHVDVEDALAYLEFVLFFEGMVRNLDEDCYVCHLL